MADATGEELAVAWRDVTKHYGSTVALDGVTIELRFGQVVGLLGPNGAGKSTLISVACGLEPITAGQVWLAPGASIGLMPQEYALYPGLTAQQNLAFVARMCGLRRRTLDEAVTERLAAVGLTEQRATSVSRFSGGMRRRLSFAAATVASPTVLLLDEPTAGVDPQSRHAILELVRRTADDGVAVLYSTHYMEEIQDLADHVEILHEGRSLVSGTVASLVEQHASASLEVELPAAQRPKLEKALAADGVHVEDLASDDDVCRLRLTGGRSGSGSSLVAAASTYAAKLEIELRDITLREATLDAAFIALTGRELRD